MSKQIGRIGCGRFSVESDVATDLNFPVLVSQFCRQILPQNKRPLVFVFLNFSRQNCSRNFSFRYSTDCGVPPFWYFILDWVRVWKGYVTFRLSFDSIDRTMSYIKMQSYFFGTQTSLFLKCSSCLFGNLEIVLLLCRWLFSKIHYGNFRFVLNNLDFQSKHGRRESCH